MITLRMVGIAAAILLAIPLTTVLADHAIGHIQVPGGEVVNAGLEAVARVTDIELLETPGPRGRAVAEFKPEQLVEGHIVFITIDIQRIVNETNFSLDIIGNVECSLHSDVEGEFFAGIVPIPERINEAHAECEAGGRVFMTPDPFIDSENAQASSSGLQPTRTWWVQAPSGEMIDVQEYEYTIVTMDWLGKGKATKYYAWSVPVTMPFLDLDGDEKRWFCPMPEARISQMGLTSFLAFHESELPEWLHH